MPRTTNSNNDSKTEAGIKARLSNLRKPLTGIIGFLDLYKSGSLKPQKEDFEKLEKQALLVVAEINDILGTD